MALLQGVISVLVLLASLSYADHNLGAGPPTQAPQCPGKCVQEAEICNTALNETDCIQGFKCCVDHLESTTEDPYWAVPNDFNPAAYSQESLNSQSYLYSTDDATVDSRYEYAYSEEPDEPVGIQMDTIQRDVCPGNCLPDEYAEYCEYIIMADGMCEPGVSTCCVTKTDAEKLRDREDYVVAEETDSFSRRSPANPTLESICPGTCVRETHAMYCDEALPQYPCPRNSVCCVKRGSERLTPGTLPVECTGQCLSSNMHGYCFPPNELIVGATTCARGTTCCMRRLTNGGLQTPSLNRMKFPILPPTETTQVTATPVVLGHLAVDDAGNIFKVSPNGQISPLPRLMPDDHMRRAFTEVTSFSRANGKLVIYSDSNGMIYQQFYPHETPSASFETLQTIQQQPPMFRKPINQFVSQASEHAANFEGPPDDVEKEQDLPAEDEAEEIVIPDDDDEVPVPATSPPMSAEDHKLATPPCPGSCMSYFLRFTCFRGHAIYDGFVCPGRLVCCARLKDIEDHEEYLKSLSPYFNAPPATRDPNLPRCGIKGWRDTPRIMGGKGALPGEWCWQVAVINTQNQYVCGGALIDNSWVLTAAHCVAGPTKENQPLFVRAGVTDLKSPEDNSRGQTVRVLSAFIHHNFNNMNLDNDIALLRLQKPLELNDNICVICLPTSGQMPKENARCTVTGYGFVSEDGDMSLKIREADVPIIDDMDCMTNVTEALSNPFILPASSFCAGGQGQQDACQGDAGGPLACKIGGYHELVGLVSWGLGCGRSDVPSIYVKVPSFMGWINQIISSSSFLMSLNQA